MRRCGRIRISGIEMRATQWQYSIGSTGIPERRRPTLMLSNFHLQRDYGNEGTQ